MILSMASLTMQGVADPRRRQRLLRCGIVDPATSAVYTKRPYGDGEEHHGFEAVHGGGEDRRLVAWRGEADNGR